ncbi:TraR/DksA C4-type zinc finger protein [Paenibacillus sp. M1]|uniref:TraR/DksA C4-type zinc finger protein n=1 Tax=Paenibacillus haidiansis TaxID=1574488 RepID=A0ABU7VU13_9BACL
MSHLTQTQLQHLKELLRQEKRELEAHFDAGAPGGDEESLRNTTGELSLYDNHPADVGTEVFERERDMAVDDNLGQRLDEINEALERLANGDDYGRCAVCGAEIPFERLKAVPYTAFCVEHTPERDAADYRPVEEQVITPPPKGSGERRQRDAGRFDDANAWRTVEGYGNSDSPATASKRNAKNYDSLAPGED